MHVEYLRDVGDALPVHPAAGNVESLVVWHCKFKSFTALSAYAGLRSLVVAGYPHESFSIVQDLRYLRELRVLHFPKVTDLGPLESLQQLETLSLETLPSWDASGKRLRVASLAPIGKLQALRSLELLGVVPLDGGLKPLEACRGLTYLKLLGYSAEAKAALLRALPKLA